MTPRVFRIFNVVATINFLSFWVVVALIGDAINGHTEMAGSRPPSGRGYDPAVSSNVVRNGWAG
jgi:hypothetical protein